MSTLPASSELAQYVWILWRNKSNFTLKSLAWDPKPTLGLIQWISLKLIIYKYSTHDLPVENPTVTDGQLLFLSDQPWHYAWSNEREVPLLWRCVVNCGLRSHPPDFIKTATPIHVCMVFGCFWALMAEVIGFNRHWTDHRFPPADACGGGYKVRNLGSLGISGIFGNLVNGRESRKWMGGVPIWNLGSWLSLIIRKVITVHKFDYRIFSDGHSTMSHFCYVFYIGFS